MGWCPGCGCAPTGGPEGEPDIYCEHCDIINGTDPNAPACFRVDISGLGCSYGDGTSYLYRVGTGCLWQSVTTLSDPQVTQNILLGSSELTFTLNDNTNKESVWTESTKACMEYDETALVFDSMDVGSDCEDSATATLTITAAPLNTSAICECIDAFETSGGEWTACWPSRMPWNGVSVTISSLTNGSGSCCATLNGTYVFNGPPCDWTMNVACGSDTYRIQVFLGNAPTGFKGTCVRVQDLGTGIIVRQWILSDRDCASYASTAMTANAGTICSGGTCLITAL